MPLIIAGIVQDQEYFDDLVEPRVDGDARPLHRPGGPGSPRRAARRSARAPAPRQLRRAVRVQRRRSDGVRHAGDRHPRAVDARDRPRRRERLPGRLLDEAVAAVRASGATGRAAVRASVERRFDVDRMVDDYLAALRRVVALDRATRVGNVSDLCRRRAFRLGVNYWPARTAMAWWSRLRSRRRSPPTSRGSPRAGSTRSGSSCLGGLPTGPRRGRPAHARSAGHGGGSRRPSRSGARAHPLHRST